MINMIRVMRPMVDEEYEVGKNGVTKIVDNPVDEPHAYVPGYDIYKGDKKALRLEGVPVAVHYDI